MKLFKKSVSLFLALLMVFGSVSLLATAADAELNWSVDTKFYRQVGEEWIETTKAAKGEHVKARVFLTTDFDLALASLLYFYPSEFLTPTFEGYDEGSYKGSIAVPVNGGKYTANLASGKGYDNIFDDMIYEGYITEDDIADKSWIYMGPFKPVGSAMSFDGSEWFFEIDFTVNEEPEGDGQFFMALDFISDYDNWLAPTTITGIVDGEEYISTEVPTGTFGYTLNDTDADSSLSCDNTVEFKTNEGSIDGTTSYTGYIGDKLSTIADFSIPTASADGKMFLGWSTDGKTALTNDQIKALTVGYEPLTLTAVFQAANATYKQNVYTMGTDGKYGAAVSTDIGSTPGTLVNASSYSVPAGFTLDTAESTAGDVEVNAENTAELNIYLKRNEYTATFGETEVPALYGAEYKAPAGADTETGIFEYWVNAADPADILYAGDTAIMGLDGATYTAKYKTLYTVSYAFAGTVPAGKEDEVPADTKVTAGGIIAKPEVEVPAGYTLAWAATGATENADGTFTAGANNVTLTGTWAKIPYTVTYVYGGEIPDGYKEPAATTLTIGEAITEPVVEIPDGYTLTWETEGDVNGAMGTAPVIMTGTWALIDYKVTYEFTGAAPAVDLSAYQKTDANIGDEIDLPEMEAAGWTFLGWTVAGADESEGVYTVGTSDVTVTGKWVKNTYVVNYWLDDAMTEIYFSETYSFGESVEVPEDPTDDILPEPGTTFVMWQQDVIDVIDADTETYFVEDPDVAGRYVYDNIAAVTDIEYTVTVYFIGVPGEEDDPETEEDESAAGILEGYLYGDTIEEADLPGTEIEGYKFNGWKIGASTPSFPYTVTSDVTIRGYFEILKFKATFYANEGAWLNGDTVRSIDVDYGTQIPSIELPIREGYHLDEEMPWGVELGEMYDEPQEFYAEWIPNEYTITFVYEGNTVSDVQNFEEGITLPEFTVDPATAKPGYELAGWTADGGATVIADITTVTVPLDGATYTAVYKPASGGVDYTVNRYFMDTEGNYGEADSITLNEVAETPVSYGETFTGFTLDTTAGKLSDTVAGDGSTVLNAYYKRNAYTVTYSALGETVDTAEVYYEADLSVSDDFTAAPAGYEFLGWSRSADATKADADLGAMGAAPVTLYAVLNPINYPVNYVIAYEGNEVAYTTQSVAYKSAITAPTAPTAELPEGYSFIGWAATKGATEALADLGTMDTTVAEGKTFYAVLESSTTVEYTVEKYFMGTDGKTYTKDASKTDVLKDGVAGVEKTVTPGSYEGFTFDSDNAENVLTAMVKGDGTTIFKVYYDRNTVKVTINGTETEKYYGEEIKEEDMPAHPTAPEGKEPDGWVDGKGDPVEFPVKVGTEDIVITPNYKPSEFEITFMNGDEEVQKSNQTFGEILSVPADVNVPGYTFDGWFADGVKVEAGVTTVPSKATTYTAKLTPINYTVTFIDKNGTVATGEYAFGTKISEIAPAYTAPAGYGFGGWSLDGSTKVEFTDDVTVPVNGVTYYAILNPAEGTAYTVETYVMNTNGTSYAKSSATKYDVTDTVINFVPEVKIGFTVEDRSVLTGKVTGDGLMIIKVYYSRNKVSVQIGDEEAKEYYYGETIEKDKPTADEGYEFTGWTDSEGKEVTFPYTVPATNVTITPNFEPIAYEVIFIVADQKYSKGSFDFGTAIVNPGDPAQERIPGYTFMGWAKEENGAIVDLATETVPVNGVTYYAVLQANDVNYTVKKVFQNTDGHSWGEPVDEIRTAKAGTTIELKAADENVNGFTVQSIEPAKAVIAGNGSTVIYIYYTRNTVSITVNGEKDDYYYGEKIEEPEEPEKDGYTFGGWVDETGKEVEFPITAEKDIVITPVFTANTVSLSFEVDGVTVEGYPVEAKVDSVITAPTAPKKEGYNFVDWYIKGTNTAFNGKMPTADTVYEARYTAGANTKVTIEIYTMNTDGKTYEKTVAYTFGVTGTTSWVEANNDLPGLTPNLEKSHLSDVVVADGSTVLTIYYDRDLYKVTWNVDGTVTTEDVYYGAEIIAPAEPKKDGFVFAGWTPEVPATMPESNLDFAATWAEDVYSVTYVVNGVKTTETYAYGATVTVKEAPEAEGMTFNGWFDGDTEYVPGTTFEMPANDVIIVADFAVAIFKVTYLNADGSVFATEMVRYGDEIPVPDDKPVKAHFEFVKWNIIYDKMPANDIEVEPVFERIAVKLIAKGDSSTQIDRDNYIITGLKQYLKEGTLRSTYLDVEGDGFFTVTPSASDYCGTGAKVELYDNLDPSTPIETYVIVIYGDIDGDSLATAVDSTWADDEGLMITNWSEENVYDPAQGAVVVNSNYDLYKVMAADLNGDGIIDATDAQIIGDVSIGMLRINQVTGRAS
ncbi:MAG: InlB B-repeat-containing protein [Acutalibacteraceae bacterium]|nr:InlB B-repeat-containing protein [Acutalibacteraceae bacterium]